MPAATSPIAVSDSEAGPGVATEIATQEIDPEPMLVLLEPPDERREPFRAERRR